MSAGSSPAGRAFAARHADCLFMVIVGLETLEQDLRAIRGAAGARPIGVYASGHIVCRRTQREAEEYHRYIVHDMGDWDAVERVLAMRANQRSIPPERLAEMKERMIGGLGTFAVVGSPDRVAQTFKRMSDAGLDGMALAFVNYLDELPFVRDELLPRLERLGLRRPMSS